MLSTLVAAAMLSGAASLPAVGQGTAGYDYPGEYAGRFDGTTKKPGPGTGEKTTIHGGRSLSVGKRAKKRKTGGGDSLAPGATGSQTYWDVPQFQGGTKVNTQGKGGRRLQAK
jgi:hypothetical protein